MIEIINMLHTMILAFENCNFFTELVVAHQINKIAIKYPSRSRLHDRNLYKRSPGERNNNYGIQ